MFFNVSLLPSQSTGYAVGMQTTHPKHIRTKDEGRNTGEKVAEDFSTALNKAFWDANQLQNESEKAINQMVVAPETIDIHQVMIAVTKAETSLEFMKSLTDRVVHAYRELTQLR